MCVSISLSGGKVASIIWFLPDIVFPVVILYFLYLSGILGAGDIKLFSVVCAFTNLRFTALCMAAAFVAAAGYGLISMVLKKELFVRMRDGVFILKRYTVWQIYAVPRTGESC